MAEFCCLSISSCCNSDILQASNLGLLTVTNTFTDITQITVLWECLEVPVGFSSPEPEEMSQDLYAVAML